MAEMDMEDGARESGTEKEEGWSWGPEGQGWAVAFGKGCAPTGTHGQLFFFFFFLRLWSPRCYPYGIEFLALSFGHR